MPSRCLVLLKRGPARGARMPCEPDDKYTIDVDTNPPTLGSSETDEKSRQEQETKMLKWVASELNKRHEKTFRERFVVPLLMVVATLAGLVVCAALCVPCLMGILVFSALTCPCMPVMNLPLWSAIFILIFQGWSLTNGHMSLIWS